MKHKNTHSEPAFLSEFAIWPVQTVSKTSPNLKYIQMVACIHTAWTLKTTKQIQTRPSRLSEKTWLPSKQEIVKRITLFTPYPPKIPKPHGVPGPPALFFPLATELNELELHRRDAKGQQWFQNKLDEATYIRCSWHKSPRHNASKYFLGSTSGTQPLDGRDSRAKTLTRNLQVFQRQILPGVMGFGGFQMCSPTRSLWPCFLLDSQCHYGFAKRFWTQDRNRLHECRVTVTWLLWLILILMLVDRVVAVKFVSMDLRMNKCSKNWGPVGKGTKIKKKSHQNIRLEKHIFCL